MSHGNAFPVLTQEECRQILHHVRRIGPVRFPWELAVLFVAVVALAFSLALLTLHSWIPFASSVALLATSFLLFQLLLHECAHDALFRSRSLNTISGWLIGLLAITPFFSFRRGHAVHHSCLQMGVAAYLAPPPPDAATPPSPPLVYDDDPHHDGDRRARCNLSCGHSEDDLPPPAPSLDSSIRVVHQRPLAILPTDFANTTAMFFMSPLQT